MRYFYIGYVFVLVGFPSFVYGQVAFSNATPNDRLQSETALTFYALGDWGTGYVQQEPVAIALERNVSHLSTDKKIAPFVVGLGDNIYESGLPFHKSSEALIYAWNDLEVFNLLENTFGQVYNRVRYQNAPVIFHVVPGNHDYDGSSYKKNKKYGDVLLQESKAENLYPGWWKYYPIDHTVAKAADTNDFREYVHLRTYVDDHGFYGLTLPQKLDLPKQNLLSIIALDTQIILEMYEEDEQALLQKHWARLDSLLLEDKDVPWKMIIGHHPIASWGLHGGAQGGLKGVFRYGVGMMQDLQDGDYKKFRQHLAFYMKKHNVYLYLAGHDHNLQFMRLNQQDPDLLGLDDQYFQLVSGSAGKLSSVDDDHQTIGIYDKQKGFVRFDMGAKTCWIEFLTYDPNTGNDRSVGIWKITQGVTHETQ